jgi:hypothetical protein
MSRSITSPSRTPASKPASTMSNSSSVMVTSSLMAGWAARKPASRGPDMNRLHGVAEVASRRLHQVVEQLTGFAQSNAARRTLDERNADPVFQPLQGLADCRSGDAETLAGHAEVEGLRDRQEHRHALEVIGHWLAYLTGLSPIGK